MNSLKLLPNFICLVTMAFVLVGCGKKANNSKAQSSVKEPRTDTVEGNDTEAYLAKQKVFCEEGEACPNYIAKIVVFDNNKTPRICTGFLVKENIVATSTSCLPDLLRLKDQDCSTDVTLFFPETNISAMERVACKRVLQVSDLTSSDAGLWRD